MNTGKLIGRAFLCAAAGMTTLMACNSKANQSEAGDTLACDLMHFPAGDVSAEP